MYSAIDMVVEAFSEKLRAAKRNRDARVRSIGKSPTLPKDDPVEMAHHIELGPRSIDCYLEYVDAAGVVSSRTVAVTRIIETKNSLLLSCYCFERQAPRSFSLDGILELIDLSTGQVVDDPYSWVKENLGYGYNERSFELLASEVTVLLALGCSDGQVVEEELDFIKLHIDQSGLVPPDQIAFTDKALSLTSINERTLEAALKVIRYSDAEQKRKLMKSARQVVDADGVLHANEIAAVEHLMKQTAANAALREND